MLVGHDHTILVVSNPEELEGAAGDLSRLGFSITRRDDEGAEASPTANFLVCFADGSYVEALTVRGAEHRAGHRLAGRFEAGDGWADYSLWSSSLAEDQDRLVAAGLPTRGPLRHARRLSDGRPWSVSLVLAGIGAGHPAMPFLIEDEEGRALRIPAHNATHPNGVTGTVGVAVVVSDLAAADRALSVLYGPGKPLPRPYEGASDGRRYGFNGRWVDVVQAAQGDTPLRRHLEGRGEGVFEVAFLKPGLQEPVALDPRLSRGARMVLTAG